MKRHQPSSNKPSLTSMSTKATPLQVVLDQIDLDSTGAAPGTLTAVTDVAIEIARDGREGPDRNAVHLRRRDRGFTAKPLPHSRSAVGTSNRPTLDPRSRPARNRQGAGPTRRGIVISGEGIVLSACRHFEATLPPHNQPLGLGSRHIAAASISPSTGAIAIVVSESSVVRVYSAGVLVTEILPEIWLLHRYLPHIVKPSFDSDDVQISASFPNRPSLGSRV